MSEREVMRILLVEDNPLIRGILTAVGSMARCEVFESPDAESALRWLGENMPDAIITDFLMPGMNGMEFTYQVRARNIDVPVVMVTSMAPYFSTDEEASIKKAGVDDIKDKPVGINQTEQLFEEIRTKVQNYRNI